jgi:hypothetical protein
VQNTQYSSIVIEKKVTVVATATASAGKTQYSSLPMHWLRVRRIFPTYFKFPIIPLDKPSSFNVFFFGVPWGHEFERGVSNGSGACKRWYAVGGVANGYANPPSYLGFHPTAHCITLSYGERWPVSLLLCCPSLCPWPDPPVPPTYSVPLQQSACVVVACFPLTHVWKPASVPPTCSG